MKKNDTQQLAIQQLAIILNYNAHVEHQHNNYNCKADKAENDEAADAQADEIDEAAARLGTKEDKVKGANKKELAQLARLYMRWHKVDDAFNIVHKFEEQNEERDLDRWILSGWLALYANNYAAAETFFRNATLIDPTSFEATNGLALALLDQSNKEKLNR